MTEDKQWNKFIPLYIFPGVLLEVHCTEFANLRIQLVAFHNQTLPGRPIFVGQICETKQEAGIQHRLVKLK